MALFRRHYPNYVDLDRDKIPVYDFHTTEQLLDLPPVKEWAKDLKFSHYALCRSSFGEPHSLMEISDEGKVWRVVGMMKGDVSQINLPIWSEDE